MSWLGRLHQKKAELAETDPWQKKVEATVHGMDVVSTVAILDLIDVPKTTSNCRRVANIMRALNFVPIKSRRLMPGGRSGTCIRGWAHPIRPSKQGEKVESLRLDNPMSD